MLNLPSQVAKDIVADIDIHLQKSIKPNYQDFYIGVTKDIEDRLFTAHNVPREGHWFIYSEAINDVHARAVEKHYLDKGMHGGGGGGDNTATYVYCYEIASFTNE